MTESFGDVLVVPKDRVKVYVGKKGSTKKKLEELLGIKLEINIENSEIKFETQDPENYLLAKEILKAIALGFTPDEALELMDQNKMLYVFDLKELYGKRPNVIARYKGRVIGAEGKARKRLEELTNTKIVIHDNTIAIIGSHEDVLLAKEAIEMLLRGSKHTTVFSYVERKLNERYLMLE